MLPGLTCLAGSRYAHVTRTRLSRRFPLRPCYPDSLISPVFVTPNLLSDFLPLPDWTLFLSLTFTALTPVCTCISHTCIYTGLEMGRSPSSIYFATTLVSRLVRSHELSLDRSSSLAKAIRFACLRVSRPLSTRLPVVKCSLRSARPCARNRHTEAREKRQVV